MDVANVTEELNLKFYLIMINLHLNCYMWLQYWILSINTEIFKSKDYLCFPRHWHSIWHIIHQLWIIVKWTIQWKNNHFPQNITSMISRCSLQQTGLASPYPFIPIWCGYDQVTAIFCFWTLRRTCKSWPPRMGCLSLAHGGVWVASLRLTCSGPQTDSAGFQPFYYFFNWLISKFSWICKVFHKLTHSAFQFHCSYTQLLQM